MLIRYAFPAFIRMSRDISFNQTILKLKRAFRNNCSDAVQVGEIKVVRIRTDER
jgi:hypothetical protein